MNIQRMTFFYGAFIARFARGASVVITSGLMLINVTGGAQTVCYVSQDGDDTSGTSWTTAFRTISNGITHATGTTNTVLVSNGTYTLTAQIQIENAITVTSLNGSASTFVNGNYPASNIRCFYLNHTNAVVDGFTITNGYLPAASGGGVWVKSGSFRNCTIMFNTGYQYGGGVYMDETGVVSRCTIVSNKATHASASQGGGVAMRSICSLRDCTIQGNSGTNGSGVSFDSGAPEMVNCIVSNNIGLIGVLVSGSGGTISNSTITCHNSQGLNMTLTGIVDNCEISRNGAGGGQIIGNTNYSTFMQNCRILNNYGDGYGMYLKWGTIKNCLFSGNSTTSRGAGVRLYWGGIIRNCKFINNLASVAGVREGGGICVESVTSVPPTEISSCTIASNQAYYGGGIYFYKTTSAVDIVYNCIIASNRANNTASGHEIYMLDSDASNAVTFSCIPSYTGLAPGQANITNASPQFADIVGGDVHLLNNSPCINTGTNQAWMEGAVDLDGHRRIDLFRRVVDMGAYEYMHGGTLFFF